MAPQSGIENVHQMALSTVALNKQAIVPLIHAERIACKLDSSDSQLCAESTFEI